MTLNFPMKCVSTQSYDWCHINFIVRKLSVCAVADVSLHSFSLLCWAYKYRRKRRDQGPAKGKRRRKKRHSVGFPASGGLVKDQQALQRAPPNGWPTECSHIHFFLFSHHWWCSQRNYSGSTIKMKKKRKRCSVGEPGHVFLSYLLLFIIPPLLREQ